MSFAGYARRERGTLGPGHYHPATSARWRTTPGKLPLLLAAGELLGVMVAAAGDAHLIQHLVHTPTAFRAGYFQVKQRQLHVFEYRQFIDQIETLEHEADVLFSEIGALSLGVPVTGIYSWNWPSRTWVMRNRWRSMLSLLDLSPKTSWRKIKVGINIAIVIQAILRGGHFCFLIIRSISIV